MADNRLLTEQDLWFSPGQMYEGAKNALLYPFRNPEQTAEFGLSMAPGSGEAMSARDAWNASGRASNALLAGNWGEAASGYGDMATALAGAIPGAGIIARGTKRGTAWMDRNLPSGVNKLLDAVTPQASQDTLYAIPAWHGSPHDFDRFEFSPRTAKTGAGDNFYGEGLSFSNDKNYAHRYAGDGGKLYQVELEVDPTNLVSSHDPLWFQGLAGKRALAALEGNGVKVEHGDSLISLFHKGHDFTKLTKILKQSGMSGLSVGNYGDPLEYVIFDDSLVKILGKE